MMMDSRMEEEHDDDDDEEEEIAVQTERETSSGQRGGWDVERQGQKKRRTSFGM